MVIPEKEVPEFKQLLVKYDEGEDISVIAAFMKERCWKTGRIESRKKVVPGWYRGKKQERNNEDCFS